MPFIHRFAFAVTLVLLPAAASAAETGATCGGFIGTPCPKDMFCEPPADHCGGADLKGTCVAVPEMCDMSYRPVCGCNGKTYGNDCARRAARVARKSDGACP